VTAAPVRRAGPRPATSTEFNFEGG